MWVRRSAIRRVPEYARVPERAIDAVREGLADDEDQARAQLDDGFARFERTQPALCAYVGDTLTRPLDETALALGYFLSLAVWLSFEKAHGDQLQEVQETEVNSTLEMIELDEELRRADPVEPLDTDDVVALEQPSLLEFVNEHVNATLETHGEDVDVDDVWAVYRVILVEVMALSHSITRPVGFPISNAELLA